MQDRVFFLEVRDIDMHHWMVMIFLGILEVGWAMLGEDIGDMHNDW